MLYNEFILQQININYTTTNKFFDKEMLYNKFILTQ